MRPIRHVTSALAVVAMALGTAVTVPGVAMAAKADSQPGDSTLAEDSTPITISQDLADDSEDSQPQSHQPDDERQGSEAPPSEPVQPAKSASPSDSVPSIEDVRGAASGTAVSTQGWVTASYPTGGLGGFVIQSAGTGGACDLEGVSDAIFVYTGSKAQPAEVGTFVTVTGVRSQYNGLQQITVDSQNDVVSTTAPAEVAAPISCEWPSEEASLQAIQSMLFSPQGQFAVTNNYDANTYGSLTLSTSGSPLPQPTDVAAFGTPTYTDQVAFNETHQMILDDGSSWRFAGGKNADQIPPYVYAGGVASVGSNVKFTDPVIVDYRNKEWKVNPTTQVIGGAENIEKLPVEISAVPAPEIDQAGDLQVGGFNLENLFFTLGEDWTPACTSYGDRNEVPVSVNRCPDGGPRGAWNQENLDRQLAKLTAAINTLDADALGVMELENSLKTVGDAGMSGQKLVQALNAAAGKPGKWAFVEPDEAQMPPVGQQDWIYPGIIYQPDRVTPIGPNLSIKDQSGAGKPFANAREPFGQAFEPADGGEPFFLVSNHLKSKSAGDDTPADQKDEGQGAFNAARTAQASAISTWVQETALPTIEKETGTSVEDVVLVGDFNSYTFEDPMQVFAEAGYVNVNVEEGTPQSTSYNYDGLNGSLDHVLVSESMTERIETASTWNINSGAQIGFGYNRFNATAGDFYQPNEQRSSDHDPTIVGFNVNEPTTMDINLVNINDFHGRIDGKLSEDKQSLTESTTVDFAWTVEELMNLAPREQSLFLSAGDNVGASLFASSIGQDQATIDLLNVLGLEATAAGNHEFDAGWADLDRLQAEFDAEILGANVYLKGTTTPALPEYYVKKMGNLDVAVIGAVTGETATLVSPGGISDIEFGDPVEAVNRVASKLTKEGLADVIIAEYHEGAGGIGSSTTIEQAMAASPVFTRIVNETSASVDAIFTGHTHQEYSWEAPIPGADGKTRPVLQTGDYGRNVGQIVLTVDRETGDVESYKQALVDVEATASGVTIEEMRANPAVGEAYDITLAAMLEADAQGSVVAGQLTGPVTRAYPEGSYVDGKWEPDFGKGESRAMASSMGTLVGNALKESVADLPSPADLGIVNPGGLRADLIPDDKGNITVAQARAVLPFNNELSVVTLTGAQLQEVLEQQWQRDADGNVPSRSYLQLGFSDNFSYTSSEIVEPGHSDGRTIGVITSMTLNGEPVQKDREYRVATFNFLATGGDNFRTFAEGKSLNTGFLDWESWLKYLAAASPVSPEFRSAAVSVEGLLDNEWVAGSTRPVALGNLAVLSQGAPEIKTVSVYVGDSPAQVFPVEAGKAAFDLTIPEGVLGEVELRMETESGVAVKQMITVKPAGTPVQEIPTITLSDSSVKTGGAVTVTGTHWTPGSQVALALHSVPVALASDIRVADDGTFTTRVTIPVTVSVGKHTVAAVSSDSLKASASLEVTAASATKPPADAGDDKGNLARTGSALILGLLAAAGVLGAGGIAFVRRSRTHS